MRVYTGQPSICRYMPRRICTLLPSSCFPSWAGLYMDGWTRLKHCFLCAGVCFLMMLIARNSRKSNFLLEKFGDDVWRHGWHRLWHSSAIYWCTPMHPVFTRFGPLVYIGESDFPLRRVHEHLIRILRPEGSTQQPFFEVIRRGAVSD